MTNPFVLVNTKSTLLFFFTPTISCTGIVHCLSGLLDIVVLKESSLGEMESVPKDRRDHPVYSSKGQMSLRPIGRHLLCSTTSSAAELSLEGSSSAGKTSAIEDGRLDEATNFPTPSRAEAIPPSRIFSSW